MERADFRDDDWYTLHDGDRAAMVGALQRRSRAGESDFGGVDQWQLIARDLPPMEEALQRFARVRRASGVSLDDAFLRGTGDPVVPANTKATLLVDEGHTTNAYPVLETSGGAGATVALTYAEALVDARGQKGHRDSVNGRTIVGVRTILDWYGRQVDSTGMLGPMPYWNFLDWAPEWSRGIAPGADDGHSAAISFLYVYALRVAAELQTGVGAAEVSTAEVSTAEVGTA